MRNCTLLLVALIAIAGCRSSETLTAQRAGDRLRELAKTIHGGEEMIEAALVSLNAMRDNAAENQTSMFNTYRNELARLEDLAEKASRRGAAAAEERDLLLERWGRNLRSVRDDSLREVSAARREEVAKSFDEAEAAFGRVRTSFRPLFADLKNLGALLANDLSPGGIRAAEGAIGKANEDGRKALADLAAARQEVEDLAESIAPDPDRSR